MRTFIALELPQAFREVVAAMARQLSTVVPGRYVPRESYHLTLAFLGQTPERMLPVIESVMGQSAPRDRFVLIPDGLGKFGRARDATLWLGFRENRELSALAERLRDSLRECGVSFDEKPFKAHLTLARRTKIGRGELPPLAFPEAVAVERLTLFKSTLSPDGASYEPLHTIAFAAPRP